MKLWKYKSYEEYVKVQTAANILKINNVWVNETSIKAIYKLNPMISLPSFTIRSIASSSFGLMTGNTS